MRYMREFRCCGFGAGYGYLFISFGAGLIVASCCPYSVLIIIVAALLVLLGFSLCR